MLSSLPPPPACSGRASPGLLQGRVVRPREEDALDLGDEDAPLLRLGLHLDPLRIVAERLPRGLGRRAALMAQHVDELLPGAGFLVEWLPEPDDLHAVL